MTHDVMPGDDVLVNQTVHYQCKDYPRQTFFESNRAFTKMDVYCMEDGEYNKTSGWPQCLPDISCGWPISAPLNGTMNFLYNSEAGENSYFITIQ